MPEDAGKKRFIKDFLQQVKAGEGFIEDIRIERVVRPPGSDGQGSTALSLSGRPISDITQLLEDDLRHCFSDGFFTFRFVAALVGSGKTSLLTYLHELTKTQSTYTNLSVVVRFQLSDLLTMGGSHSFGIKLYCHILAYTFWELLHNKDLSDAVKNVAERILSELLDHSQLSQLTSARNFKIQFYPKFNKYLADSGVGFEDFFFYVLAEVSEVEPLFTFVYLTDELDALQNFPNYIQDTRSLFKALIKRACQEFSSNIRLLIYLVGTSENVGSFIAEDSVIESLVGHSVINLDKGNSNEFEMIRKKIEERIKGAYKGYKNFDQAWQEIQNILLNPANNLRTFCQNYAGAVLQIHEKYFKEEPEQVFEGDARQLVEAQCRQKWANYLNKKAYTLSAVLTTTVLAGHAFDCYVEMLHNGNNVARAFGEAKNYELLSAHLETFNQWLEDINFKPFTLDGTPPDLAFIIAPSCPSLLQKKLELKNIQFIKSDKRTDSIPVETNESKANSKNNETSIGTEDFTVSEQTSRATPTPNWIFSTDNTNAVNINKADKSSLIDAFRGTRVYETTIDKLINQRPYTDLDDLAFKLRFTQKVKTKLQEKLKKGNICF
ncbi:MAG TPA: hypothetical protein DCE56_43775 [Cyanobacteria bacterium UBA8553]|nr:hypothetical protein [Cyanobacteria bacterium UBA8553]HAJ61897.1 hypothetical protein [Cyanobacteria bacterium UBA8543]